MVEEFQFSTLQDFRVQAITTKSIKYKIELVTMATVSCSMSMQPSCFLIALVLLFMHSNTGVNKQFICLPVGIYVPGLAKLNNEKVHKYKYSKVNNLNRTQA